MHSCVFSVHSSIRPWSRSPQIYFLLGFSSDASIKLWEDDAADFRCRGGLRFMIGWSSENSRIWFISAKAPQWWLLNSPIQWVLSHQPFTIYIFSTTSSSRLVEWSNQSSPCPRPSPRPRPFWIYIAKFKQKVRFRSSTRLGSSIVFGKSNRTHSSFWIQKTQVVCPRDYCICKPQ